jgi:hypothetical protein
MAQKFIVEEYKRHYFSGSQAKVYFDNQYIGEIVYLEYNITTNKAPIYSYNSEQFRMVAKGNMLVQGNFAINFTELGYLLKIANDIKRMKINQNYAVKDQMAITYFRDTADGILQLVTQHTSETRASMIKWYKDKFWSEPGIERGSEFRLHPWEFDRDSNEGMIKEGFTITMMYGVPNAHPNMFSLKTIQDVHVSGESMVLQPTGQGLIEQYPFFARTIDEDLQHYESAKKSLDLVSPATADNVEKPMTTDVSSRSNTGQEPPTSKVNKVVGDSGVTPIFNIRYGGIVNRVDAWDALLYIGTPDDSDIVINNITLSDNSNSGYQGYSVKQTEEAIVILSLTGIPNNINTVVAYISTIKTTNSKSISKIYSAGSKTGNDIIISNTSDDTGWLLEVHSNVITINRLPQ